MPQALGISISENEVKVAYLTKNKGAITIISLDSLKLYAPLKQTNTQELSPGTDKNILPEDNFNNIFTADQIQANPTQSLSGKDKEERSETSKDRLFTFLNKYPLTKLQLAINLHPSLITYFYFPSDYGLSSDKLKKWVKKSIEDRQKKSIQENHYDYIKNDNGTIISFAYDSIPPLLESLEELRNYHRDKLRYTTMDTNEIALLNLIRDNYFLPEDRISATIYIENEFSRIMFLKGLTLHHCSDLINEGALSSNILEILFSKIIYEQDRSNIPDLSYILLASKSVDLNALNFFKLKFPKSRVEYIYSAKFDHSILGDKFEETFSEYAIPISLAWKSLDKKKKSILPTNLLPTNIVDRQKVLKLAFHGYILLAILAIVAFIFTWQISTKQSKTNHIKKKKLHIEQNLNKLQKEVDMVNDYRVQAKKFKRNMTLVDSLGIGYNELITFLEELNVKAKKIGGIWIKEIKNSKAGGYYVKGMSLQSDKISRFSYELGDVNLIKVTLTKIGTRKIFEFDFEKKIQPEDSEVIFGNLEIPDNLLIAKKDSNNINRTKEIKQNETINNRIISQNPIKTKKINKSTEQNYTNKRQTNLNKFEQQQSQNRLEPIDHNSNSMSLNNSVYTIFASMHPSEREANLDVRKIKARGYNAWIHPQNSSSNNKTWYRVYIGEYVNKEEAMQSAQKLQELIGENYRIIAINAEVHKKQEEDQLYTQNNPDNSQTQELEETITQEIDINSYDNDLDNNGSSPKKENRYTVFVNSYSSKIAALQESKKINAQGFQTKMLPYYSSTERKTYYRLYVGTYPTSAKAQQQRDKLQQFVQHNCSIETLKYDRNKDVYIYSYNLNTSSNTIKTVSGSKNSNGDYDSKNKSSTGNFTIFISSHASRITANQDIKRLQSYGLDAKLRPYTANGMKWYRVYVGKFTNLNQALEFANRNNRILGRKFKVESF